MNRMKTMAVAALAFFGAGILFTGTSLPTTIPFTAALAAESQTQAAFSIKNMTCALCPVTVKKAMEGMPGVKSVAVNFEDKTATVVFDPARATIAAIAAASTNAGYPAQAIQR